MSYSLMAIFKITCSNVHDLWLPVNEYYHDPLKHEYTEILETIRKNIAMRVGQSTMFAENVKREIEEKIFD